MNVHVEQLTVTEIDAEIQRLENTKLNLLTQEINDELTRVHKTFFNSFIDGLNKRVHYKTVSGNLVITIESTNDIKIEDIVSKTPASQNELDFQDIPKDPVEVIDNPIKKHIRDKRRAQIMVTFPNGEIITGKNGGKVFSSVLSKINYDDIALMNIVYSKISLVSKIKDPREGYQVKIGDVYYLTFLNTKKRVEILNAISKKYKLNLIVKVAY